MAVTWIEPKVNWTKDDSFEPSDFNRIKNNLNYINEHLDTPILLTSMGEDATYDKLPWELYRSNAIENNLHAVNNAFNGGSTQIGLKKTFYSNGAFITADELNRIESATEKIKVYQETVKANRGNFRNPRIV